MPIAPKACYVCAVAELPIVAVLTVGSWLFSMLMATLPASLGILIALFLPTWVVFLLLGTWGLKALVEAFFAGLSKIGVIIGTQLDPLENENTRVPGVPNDFIEVFPLVAGRKIAGALASLGGIVLGILLVRAGDYGWTDWWAGIRWTLLSSVDTLLLNLPTQLGLENPAAFVQQGDWRIVPWLISTLVALGTVTHALITIGAMLTLNEVYYGTEEGVRQYLDITRPAQGVVVLETGTITPHPRPFAKMRREGGRRAEWVHP